MPQNFKARNERMVKNEKNTRVYIHFGASHGTKIRAVFSANEPFGFPFLYKKAKPLVKLLSKQFLRITGTNPHQSGKTKTGSCAVEIFS